MNATLHLFVDASIEQMDEIFDPRKFPKATEELKTHGNEELCKLVSHYAVRKTDVFKSNRTSASADIDYGKAKL